MVASEEPSPLSAGAFPPGPDQRRLDLVVEAGRALAASPGYLETCRRLCGLAVPSFADLAVIDLLDDGAIRRIAVRHHEPRHDQLVQRMFTGLQIDPAGHHPVAFVLRTGEPHLAEDITAEQLRASLPGRQAEAAVELAVSSQLTVPLLADGRPLGAMSFVLFGDRRRFGKNELQLADDIATAATVALETARLVREKDASLALLDSVLETAPIGLGFFDRELRYLRVNDALAVINGVPAEAHIGRTLGELLNRMPEEVGADIRSVFDTGDAVVDREVSAETAAAPGRVRHWLVSYYPVRSAGDDAVLFVGATVVEITDRKRGEAERSELLDREREARSEAEAAQSRLALLAEASRLFATSLDPAMTLRNLTRLVVPLLADWAAIDLVGEDGGLRRVDVNHVDPATAVELAAAALDAVVDPGSDRASVVVLRTGQPMLIPAVVDDAALAAGDSETELAAHRLLGLRAAVVVPLRARGRLLGVLSLATGGGRRRLREDDLVLTADLASRAALAVDTARLYAEEHRVAVTLQQSFLPDALPSVEGIEVASRYVAGTVGQEVGGDWYDMVVTPHGRVAVTIGDVVGHDIRAASVMGQLRNAVRVYASEGYQPRELVTRLNRLTGELGIELMATLVHGELDRITGRFTYTSAGHLPPLVRRADGTITWLRGGASVPVGALPAAEFSRAETTLEPGAVLILYTDGLVERRSVPLDQDLDRLAVAVAEAPHSDPERLADHLLDLMLAAEDRSDDVALLILRRV